MIERRYFYKLSYQDRRQHAFGVVTLKTWRPDPGHAMREAIAQLCETRRWKSENVVVECFNRV
jgi:hypothetical protein